MPDLVTVMLYANPAKTRNTGDPRGPGIAVVRIMNN